MSAPERPTDPTPADLRGRPFSDLRDAGLLWLINRAVFHPRGYALALVMDGDEVTGWRLLGNGLEPWRYSPDADEDKRFAQAERTFTEARRAESA